MVCLEREIGEFVKRGGSGEEVVGVRLKDLEQQPFIPPAPPLLRQIFFFISDTRLGLGWRKPRQ